MIQLAIPGATKLMIKKTIQRVSSCLQMRAFLYLTMQVLQFYYSNE